MNTKCSSRRPWLSVILPSYNGEQTIRQTLESLAAEVDSNCEVIAIDDGSTDSTPDILREYQSRLPLQIISRRVRNWVANTNHGLQVATGTFSCFLHQDDYWLPGRIIALRKQLGKTPDITLLLHACEFVDLHDHMLGHWHCPLPARSRLSPGRTIERLLVQNFIALPGATFRRQTALELGGLDESLWYTADWDLWLKLAASGETVYLPNRLAGYRLHPESQTASRSRGLNDFREQMESVRSRHFTFWSQGNPHRHAVVDRVGQAVVEINVALAAAYHRQQIEWPRLLNGTGQLTLADWRRLFRDSRMLERVLARVRAGFARRHARA